MPIFAPAHVPPRPADAYASIESELSALPDHAVLPVGVDLRYAAQVAMQTARRMDALLPELVLLPEFDVGPVRRLTVYAAAALHADQMLDRPLAVVPDDPTDPMGAWLAPRASRARVYTLLVRAYDQCRRAATFLRWDHGDADRMVPPLHPVHVDRDPDPGSGCCLADTVTAA